METPNKKLLVQKGLMMGLSTPLEFSQALKNKFQELAKTSKDKQRWTSLSEGFAMGLEQQLQMRNQELENAKSKTRGRGKSQGRSR